MTVTRNRKITIYLDNSITPELRTWLIKNGDSQGGRKLLRMGYLLEQSGLADQVHLLATQKGMAKASEFELVAKAVELLAPLQSTTQTEQPTIEAPVTTVAIAHPEQAPTPEAKAPKSSLFAAGKKD